MTWAATDLCTDADLSKEETQVMEWCRPQAGAKHWRDLAKEKIAEKLRQGLKTEELATDASEVLDLILNPEILKTIAVYMSLYLLCKDKMQHPDDLYSVKSLYYKKMFDDEWKDATGMIHFDIDESGDISDSEKYNVFKGVKVLPGP